MGARVGLLCYDGEASSAIETRLLTKASYSSFEGAFSEGIAARLAPGLSEWMVHANLAH